MHRRVEIVSIPALVDVLGKFRQIDSLFAFVLGSILARNFTMSDNMFAKVREFVVRLIKDGEFRSTLEQTEASKRTDYLAEQGYSFTTEFFEAGAIELMSAQQSGEFNEVSEEELAGVFGGYMGKLPIIQPMYGVIWWPIDPIRPRPIGPQPLYGVIIGDIL
jgi:hypothetical protein